METTQSFRLDGSTKVVKISCEQDDGENVIYWDEILDVFPGAQYVKNGDVVVKKLRGWGPDGSKPPRIKHLPQAVLDVVLFSPASSDSSDTDAYSMLSTSSFDTLGDSKAVLSVRQHCQGSSMKALKSAFEQRLITSMPLDVQTQALASSDMYGWIVQAIQNGHVDRPNEQLVACLQDLKDEIARNNELSLKINELVSDVKELALKNNDMAFKNNELWSENNKLVSNNMELTGRVIKLQEAFDAKQEEMKQLQIQALGQLSLLQNQVQALMTQTYELHEYPIPRLFVILPQDTSSWDPVNLFSNKFRLYFLCECGEHTKSTNSKIPHHIHIAKHEGYEISRPTEFMQQYGPYVLTILRMLKLGISVAGVAVPAVPYLVRADALDQAAVGLKSLSGNLQAGMDQAIRCLEKATADNDDGIVSISEQMENNEALEGADLRKLETFLKNRDGNKVLGNLYRTVTIEGHVKWVCIDHYRENYHEKTSRRFRDTVESLGGHFDENIGRAKVHLRSKMQAEQFYQALENAKSVYELDIALDWDTTQNDFKKLRDSLVRSNVGALELDLVQQEGPSSDILNRNRRHDPIFDVMRHPSIRSVEIVRTPGDFVERSSLLSRNDDFSNLRHLGFDYLAIEYDMHGVKTLLSRSPNITSLVLKNSDVTSDFVYFRGKTESLKNLLSENIGRVKIQLRFKMQAEEFYRELERVKCVRELDLSLYWGPDQSDLERLRDVLTRTKVEALELQVKFAESTVGYKDRIQCRHDTFFEIMRLACVHSVAIWKTPKDLIQQSSLLAGNDDFPNLRHLDVDLSTLIQEDIDGIKSLIVKAPGLTKLVFQGDFSTIVLLRMFLAIAEYQTYPIVFAKRSVWIPPLVTESPQPLAPHEYLDHLLKGATLGNLVLGGNIQDDAVVDALAKVDRENMGFKNFDLKRISRELGDEFIKNVASIVARSEISKIEIDLRHEEGRVLMLESVQWRHLQYLRIDMDQESIGLRMMKALVQAKEALEGQVELEFLGFWSFASSPMSAEQAELLRLFMGSTRLKVLVMAVDMTPSHLVSVLNAADVSRLEEIVLQTSAFSPSQVDSVLDRLEDAAKLRQAHLNSSPEQKRRLKARGVSVTS
ncbi:hypothetical protein B0O80DRAFT_495563 [Mortierella sp. GBAus27b]|nr:hypothetical protein BGX31_005465 [Mortierella sp. GBA43]KAI8358910.1 hypothetical protein B0O80DRAFT_495563 [Mortierella sp. GBAus27b]